MDQYSNFDILKFSLKQKTSIGGSGDKLQSLWGLFPEPRLEV